MAARDQVKVAAAQYPIGRPGSMHEWRDKAARCVADGAAVAAELERTPSLLSPKPPPTWMRSMPNWRGSTPCTSSRRAAPPRADGRFVNAARLITPAGRSGVQEKRMLTPFERAWGVALGRQLRVFETVLGRIGVAICYDSEFPLLVRAEAEAGAELILIPSCTEYLSGYHRVRAAAQARALESQISTIVSPTVGDALWSPAVDRNVGAAGVFVPADRLCR
jgi:predicted amidohydrolase